MGSDAGVLTFDASPYSNFDFNFLFFCTEAERRQFHPYTKLRNEFCQFVMNCRVTAALSILPRVLPFVNKGSRGIYILFVEVKKLKCFGRFRTLFTRNDKTKKGKLIARQCPHLRGKKTTKKQNKLETLYQCFHTFDVISYVIF